MHNKLFIITIAAVVFTVYNIHQYNRSFDRCEALLTEVHQNLKKLHNELATLNAAVNGIEVDYE